MATPARLPASLAAMQRRPLLALATLPLAAELPACTTTFATAVPTPPPPPVDHAALDHALAALVNDPHHPVVSVQALAIRQGQVVYRGAFGHRHLGHHATPLSRQGRADEAPLPMTTRTLVRVASISKLVVAVAVMRLVEAGVLDLDRDVSTWLGWPLRHPAFPDQALSLRLLLSHRSGLSDAGETYSFDGSVALQDVLQPGGRHFADGRSWRAGRAPGTVFEYVNLNFGVVAQVMEGATGERFDRLMQRLVLQPLGLRGGFNPADFPAADQADIATQYRKRRDEAGREVWNPAGPWVVQADDFRHTLPEPPPGLAGYTVGRNGTLFGPQGRLRICLDDLGLLMQVLLAGGRHQGRAFLQPASVAQLAAEQWRLAPDGRNGDVGRDWARSWGVGVQRFTDHSGGVNRGDRLTEGGGLTGWGHTGDAYGLQGLFVLDPERQRGLVLLITGPGVDPATWPGQWSALTRWQERASTAVVRHALG